MYAASAGTSSLVCRAMRTPIYILSWWLSKPGKGINGIKPFCANDLMCLDEVCRASLQGWVQL